MGLGILRGALLRRGVLKSLSEYSEGSCSEGFCWWPRRRGRRIPAAGLQRPSQRRPPAKEPPPGGFSRKRSAGFVTRRSQTPAGMLPPRASPSDRFRENRTPLSIRTGSNLQSPAGTPAPGRQGARGHQSGRNRGNLLSRRWQRQRESWDGQGGMVRPAPSRGRSGIGVGR